MKIVHARCLQQYNYAESTWQSEFLYDQNMHLSDKILGSFYLHVLTAPTRTSIFSGDTLKLQMWLNLHAIKLRFHTVAKHNYLSIKIFSYPVFLLQYVFLKKIHIIYLPLLTEPAPGKCSKDGNVQIQGYFICNTTCFHDGFD